MSRLWRTNGRTNERKVENRAVFCWTRNRNSWQGFGNDKLNCFIVIANSIWPLYLGVHPMVLDSYSPLSASLFDTNINCLLPTIFRCTCIFIQSRLLVSNWLIFWRNFGLLLVLNQVGLSNNIIHSFCPSYFLLWFHHRFPEFDKNIGYGFVWKFSPLECLWPYEQPTKTKSSLSE